ncbi:excinuclease ABC subunit UvrC [Candidatus Saccharibacteria bacterium]|nr:excinuclease ABC subunit UvrC [Candidatus Saccharibacteria bacterium]
MNQQLQAKLKTLPSNPGVYFHKNASGEIIYVGKAAVLKNRVRQYFQKSRDVDAKTWALVSEIVDVDWTITESELDALFLESEMIKRYLPRYNIMLRDDKSQTFVRINMRDAVPFVSFTRQPADDGADYYGPFYSGIAVKNALKILRKIFPYFTKKYSSKSINSKLNVQLGLEPNIENGVTKYKKDLRKLTSYIKGNRIAVINEIKKEMEVAAKAQDFELAAKLRNQLFNLNELRKQIVFGRDEFLDISKDQALVGLCDLLNLPEIPRRIEAYDVSHISGQHNVSSMVVATNGVADRREYRKFKLKTSGNDDCAHMRETIKRRLKHLKDWGRPDLVIIDGGIGQLSAVADLLNDEKIPFIGRNKSGNHSRNASVKIIFANLARNDPAKEKYENVELGTDNHVAKLIARLDDESHRFAVSYHQVLRGKNQTKNILEEIPGIGASTRTKLLKKFGSLATVKNASESELAVVIGSSKAKLVASCLASPGKVK